MHATLWDNYARAESQLRLEQIAGLEVETVDSKEAFLAAARDSDAVILPGYRYDADVAETLCASAPRLRWIHVLTAGYEALQLHGVPGGVVVTNGGEAWSVGVAEHVMALLLALAKRLPVAFANQRDRVWQRGYSQRMGSLLDKTLLIVGFGSIGRHVARHARSFGMRVTGVSRSGRPDALADEIHPAGALLQVLPRADAIVLAVPSSPQTAGLIGARELAACKPGAFLVNVGRGNALESAALAEALASGHLAGAALDVTDPEPLPPDSLLWDAPNLIVTPHVGGVCGEAGRIRVAEVAALNATRFVAGETLSNIVAILSGPR